MIEHHIQIDILNRLSRAPSLRFSQLKPKELQANLFMYHLKQLIKSGYVEKTAHSYQLAPLGLTYVDSLSLTNGKPRKQPKVISILAVRNEDGSWLLGRRKLQPYIGQWMFLSGKQHFGESSEEHMQRELLEKVRVNIPLERVGLVDIRISRGGHTISHAIGHVYTGIAPTQAVPTETEQHIYEWHHELPDSQLLMPGTKELFEILAKNERQFFVSVDADI